MRASRCFWTRWSLTLISHTWTVTTTVGPSGGSSSFVLPEAGPGYYSALTVPSCVVRPKRRPQVKASCKIYVHAAVSAGEKKKKINIAGVMHGDD